MILCGLFSCLGTPISSITPFDVVSEQKDPRIPNQHRVGTILRFRTRRRYVCTSLCSQKYVLFSCGLILTDFSGLSSGAGINFDCPGNTDFFLLFFDYGIAVFDRCFPYSAFFFCRPHAGAHGGFWKNLLPVPLPHTQPTRRHILALAVNSLEERFVKQARNRRFDSWPAFVRECSRRCNRTNGHRFRR